jgi:hypothetical protein
MVSIYQKKIYQRPERGIHKDITTLANPKVVDKDEAEVTMESIVKSLGGRRIPPRGK